VNDPLKYCPQWTTGIFGNALSFNQKAVRNGVNISNSNGVSLSKNFTISFWIKNGVLFNALPMIMFKGSSDGGENYLFLEYPDGTMDFNVLTGCGEQISNNNATTFNLRNNTGWYNVVGIYYNTSTVGRHELWINGTLFKNSSARACGAPKANSAPLYLGNEFWSYTREWNGTMDEIEMYNYSWSQQEIKDHYFNGLGNLTKLGAMEQYSSGALYLYNLTDPFSYSEKTAEFLLGMRSRVDILAYSESSSRTASLYISKADNPAYNEIVKGSATFLRPLIDSFAYNDIASRIKMLVRSLSDSFAYADNLAELRTSFVNRVESFIYGESLSKVIIIFRSLSDSFSFIDAFKRVRTAFSAVADAFAYIDAKSDVLTYVRSLSEALTYGESILSSRIGGAIIYARSIIDSFAHSDSISNFKAAVKSLTESLTYSDALSKFKTLIKSLSDSLIYSDQMQKVLAFYRSISESFAYGESTLSQKVLAFLTYVINLIEKSTYWDKFVGSTTSTNPITPPSVFATCAILQQIDNSRAYLCIYSDGTWKILIKGS
jgi:hypothetical protein